MNPYRLKVGWKYLYLPDAWFPVSIIRYIGRENVNGEVLHRFGSESVHSNGLILYAKEVRNWIIPCPEHLQKYIKLFSSDNGY